MNGKRASYASTKRVQRFLKYHTIKMDLDYLKPN
jgi:hypothetical protein